MNRYITRVVIVGVFTKRVLTGLVLLLSFFSVVQAVGQPSIDSLKFQAETGSVAEKAEALMELFLIYRFEDLDSALYYVERSRENALKAADSLMVVRTETAIGYVYNEKGLYQKAIDFYERALERARRNGLRDREKFILNYLGLTNYYYGKYDDALQYHFKSLSLREEEDNKLQIAISCNNIGLVYYQIKDYRNAIEYFLKSLNIKKMIEDDNKIESTLINLGLCYSALEKHDEALANFDRVLSICNDRGCDEKIKIEALHGSGLAFYALGNLEQGKVNLQKSYEMAEEGGLKMNMVNNLHFLARIEKELNNRDKALELLNRAQQLAIETDSRVWVNKNYKLYGEIYSALGDYEQAYAYQIRYDSISGVILNEEVIQNLAEIQIAYQEKENIQTINYQKSEISRRTTLLFLLLIIILLAVVILTILYRNNQLRQKVNQKLYDANATIEKQNHELTHLNSELEERVKERTRELNASNTALLKSNTELDNFIYKTSHDIRGPLATLQGVCNVALIDIEDEKSIGYFVKLSKTAERLNEILSKLLVINQINNSLISEQLVDFKAMVDELVEECRDSSRKNINLQVDIEDGLNFKSDQDLLRIILSNLISNAFKFYNTSERIESFVKIEIGQADSQLYIRVIDNGIGIDDHASYKIFEIFSKASDVSDTAGLGLYLVKLAVEKLGGQISLVKSKDNYTQFEASLPAHN